VEHGIGIRILELGVMFRFRLSHQHLECFFIIHNQESRMHTASVSILTQNGQKFFHLVTKLKII